MARSSEGTDLPDAVVIARNATRQHALARLSAAFLIDQAAGGVAGLAAREALLVLAINQANIAHLTRDHAARSRFGQLEAPAPDDRRRPVSVLAIAQSLDLPFETVRRHVRRLEQAGVCEKAEGGVIVPERFLGSADYMNSVLAGHLRLHHFFQTCRSLGLVEPLPQSAYAPEPEVPIRAAARLLSDYLLRTAELLLAELGDLTSMFVLLAALEADGEPLSLGALTARLQIPQETVRRHAVALAERGWLARTPRGFARAEGLGAGPVAAGFLRDNAANVQRLFAGLAERGVVEAWDRLAEPARAAG